MRYDLVFYVLSNHLRIVLNGINSCLFVSGFQDGMIPFCEHLLSNKREIRRVELSRWM